MEDKINIDLINKDNIINKIIGKNNFIKTNIKIMDKDLISTDLISKIILEDKENKII